MAGRSLAWHRPYLSGRFSRTICDNAVSLSKNSPIDMQSNLNVDLPAITSWLYDNKLTPTVTKSKPMVSSIIQLMWLVMIDQRKLLNSVAINQYLTWHDHIDQLETWGLKRELNVYLFAQGRFLSRRWSSPILLSKSIVQSDKDDKVFVDSFQVLQNKAAKLVLYRAPNCSSA